jgi:hypothetical protein
VRHLLPSVVWWVACWWLWILFAGEWNRYEWVAASGAATVCAGLTELARTSARVRARLQLEWLARLARVPPQIFVDFGILLWALARSAATRKVVRGTFRAHELPLGGTDPTAVGTRAFVTWAANFSPNAIAVDIDAERGISLVHDLVPNRASEEPACTRSRSRRRCWRRGSCRSDTWR